MNKKIYFGGQFRFMYKDYTLEKLAEDYRAKILGGVEKLVRKPDNGLVKTSKFIYCGPYYFYEDNTTAEDVVKEEANSIEVCDEAWFIIENKPAPGTITEIVQAVLKNKHIVIFYIKKKQFDVGEPEREIKSDMWYPMLYANIMNPDNELHSFETYEDAEKALLNKLNTL